MKKSILILTLPCLLALSLIAGKVYAADDVNIPPHKRPGYIFDCSPSDEICYEWHHRCVKMLTVKGHGVVLSYENDGPR